MAVATWLRSQRHRPIRGDADCQSVRDRGRDLRGGKNVPEFSSGPDKRSADIFTEKEIAYLNEQGIGRLATVDSKGHPHVVPTGFHFDAAKCVFEIGAADTPGRGQKRLYLTHIRANPGVALVVDDVVTQPEWAPRGVSVRGRAHIHPDGGQRLGPGFGPIWTEVIPESISAWGIDTATYDPPNFRKIGSAD